MNDLGVWFKELQSAQEQNWQHLMCNFTFVKINALFGLGIFCLLKFTVCVS